MKIIYNDFIPFNGYKAITVFNLIFVRNGHKIDEIDINHESIHFEQIKDCFYLFFYPLYIFEFLFNLFKMNAHDAYENISFEKEAYDNENNLNYIKTRKKYNWIKYLK